MSMLLVTKTYRISIKNAKIFMIYLQIIMGILGIDNAP